VPLEPIGFGQSRLSVFHSSMPFDNLEDLFCVIIYMMNYSIMRTAYFYSRNPYRMTQVCREGYMCGLHTSWLWIKERPVRGRFCSIGKGASCTSRRKNLRSDIPSRDGLSMTRMKSGYPRKA